MPRLDDVRKALAGATTVTPADQPAGRPRWLLAGAVALAAVAGTVIAGVVLIRDKAIREPLGRALTEVRDRVTYFVGSVGRRLRGERTELIALDVAPAAEVPVIATAPIAQAEPMSIEEPVLVESGDPC